jgi:hypothetical protein
MKDNKEAEENVLLDSAVCSHQLLHLIQTEEKVRENIFQLHNRHQLDIDP